MFYSPNASHLLISCESGDVYYLHQTWTKPRILTKLHSINLTSVAWTPTDANSKSSGPILIGTSTGRLFELELVHTERKEEKYFEQIYTIESGEQITGIQYKFFPTDEHSIVVYVSTKTHLFQFISRNLNLTHRHGHLFTVFFASLVGNSDWQEIQGSSSFSKLVLHNVVASSRLPTFLVWITGFEWFIVAAGIYYGQQSIADQNNGDSTITQVQILP
jgi:hypothetical protein